MAQNKTIRRVCNKCLTGSRKELHEETEARVKAGGGRIEYDDYAVFFWADELLFLLLVSCW